MREASVPQSTWRTRSRHAAIMVRLAVPYVVFAALKRVLPLPTLARLAWRAPAGVRDESLERAAERCALRLRRLARADRGDCLQASLALYRVLAAAGARPRLLVGFRREASGLVGHAWIDVDGRTVAEPAPTHDGFVIAAAFGDRGVRIQPDAA